MSEKFGIITVENIEIHEPTTRQPKLVEETNIFSFLSYISFFLIDIPQQNPKLIQNLSS